MTLSLVQFPEQPKSNIPALLRELADGIDAGTYPMPDAMAYVMETEFGLSAGMLGRTSEIHACGLLTIGAQFLAVEATEE